MLFLCTIQGNGPGFLDIMISVTELSNWSLAPVGLLAIYQKPGHRYIYMCGYISMCM